MFQSLNNLCTIDKYHWLTFILDQKLNSFGINIDLKLFKKIVFDVNQEKGGLLLF